MFMTIMKPMEDPSPDNNKYLNKTFYPNNRSQYNKSSKRTRVYTNSKSKESILIQNNSSEEMTMEKDFDGHSKKTENRKNNSQVPSLKDERNQHLQNSSVNIL